MGQIRQESKSRIASKMKTETNHGRNTGLDLGRANLDFSNPDCSENSIQGILHSKV